MGSSRRVPSSHKVGVFFVSQPVRFLRTTAVDLVLGSRPTQADRLAVAPHECNLFACDAVSAPLSLHVLSMHSFRTAFVPVASIFGHFNAKFYFGLLRDPLPPGRARLFPRNECIAAHARLISLFVARTTSGGTVKSNSINRSAAFPDGVPLPKWTNSRPQGTHGAWLSPTPYRNVPGLCVCVVCLCVFCTGVFGVLPESGECSSLTRLVVRAQHRFITLMNPLVSTVRKLPLVPTTLPHLFLVNLSSSILYAYDGYLWRKGSDPLYNSQNTSSTLLQSVD